MSIGLRNQIETLRKLYEDKMAEMLSCLLAGGAVEPGPHKAEIEEVAEGAQRITRLIINGRPA